MIVRPFARVALALGGLALGTGALSGCAGGEATSTAVASTPPSASATAAPPPPVIAFPGDCASIVRPAVYTATFSDTPLNDPGVIDAADAGTVAPTPSPAGASAAEMLSDAVELHCVWRDPNADITYLQVTMAHVDAAVATNYLTGLAGEAYTCADALGGRTCTLEKPNDQYPVDEGYTSFLRDNVYLSISEANFAAPNLLADMVATLWK